MSSNLRTAYFFDPDIGAYYYGPGHPMKPQRMLMTHALVTGYDLHKDMEIFRPHRAIETELTSFHDTNYVNFLAEVSGENWKEYAPQLKKFNVGEATDCPIFDGLYDFQQSCAGASVDAAMKLNHHQADVVVNWSGGLHHAKRAEASGFCYINDIVLGILELLKYHPRVMYIDIDIHHGDGVEEAFFVTHRVMTVSFHKFGDYFPGTGDLSDVGAAAGKYYAVNVPLDDGMDDESFLDIFKPVVRKAIDIYQPGAIVIQCGADSVSGDRLGKFNLSIKGHAECVRFVKAFHIPLMVLGGGGYTIRNVSRTWAYETAVVLNRHEDISDNIPMNEFYDYYGSDYSLHLPVSQTMLNKNTPESLMKLQNRIMNNLSRLEHAPGIQFSTMPPNLIDTSNEDDDEHEQYCIRWEGGGLAAGAEREEPERSCMIRRRDDIRNDEEEDRDQKEARSELMGNTAT